MPVQLTCSLTAQALGAAAANLAAQHAGEAVKAAAGSPVKLAGKLKGCGERRSDSQVQWLLLQCLHDQ